jgi:polyhydroxybutyrate depolymerase
MNLLKIALIGLSLLVLAGFTYPGGRNKVEQTTMSVSMETIEVDGIDRTFYINAPSGATDLVIGLHGGATNGLGFESLSGLSNLSSSENFIIVYPNGEGSQDKWNDGRNETIGNLDDVAFIDSIIDYMIDNYNINIDSVFVTGVSNGGMMALRLACDLSDRLSGVVAVTANMPEDYELVCSPLNTIPIAIINGDSDPFMPWNGGEIPIGAGGTVLSTLDTMEFLSQNNGCSSNYSSTLLPNIARFDKTRVRLYKWNSCLDDVWLYKVENGGHRWPDSPEGDSFLKRALLGFMTKDINGAETVWSFFK